MIFRPLLRAAAAALLFALCAPVLACSGRAHIEVQDAGVYALDYAAIAAAQPGLNNCRADELALTQRDREVPIRVVDDGHGGFGPGSRIEWLGERLRGPQSWFDQYSNVNVYLLAAAPGAHARLHELPAPEKTAAPALLRRHLHFEQENLMIRLGDREMKSGDEPDVWQWIKLTPVDPQPFVFDFDLADLRTDGEATLTLDFRGQSNIANARLPKQSDHRVEVLVNDKRVQTVEWDGRDEIRRAFTVPASWLRASGNRLKLRVPRRDAPDDASNFIIDVVMFNWFEAAYPIRGNLDASMAGFNDAASAPVQVAWSGSAPLELFGSDGTLRAATPLAGHRYAAAGAADNVDLYPFAGRALKPSLTRAVDAADLRAERGGYDYVMVTHPRLREAIQPLAHYHAAHGHKVVVVNVDDIYDQFSGGIIHPKAIRDFLAWGSEHWPVKPRFLMLVGDASVDIHHDIRRTGISAVHATPTSPPTSAMAPNAHLQPNEVMVPGGFLGMDTIAYREWDPELPNRNLIPTWQVASSSEGQSASDVPFAALKAGDFHPQFAVGRLPVIEPDEVRVIVNKTLAYLTDTTPGRWRRDMTFISTAEVESYKGASDKLAADLAERGFAVQNIYTDPHEAPAIGSAKRATLKRVLDDGSLIVHFLGHGGNYIWRVGGPTGDLFTLDDVAAMTNAGRYPLVLAMTCFSAPFDNPTADSIGERFLREAGKGAVAVFGASWSNSPDPANSTALLDELLRPGATIGEAVTRAKDKASDRTFVEMYNLLGDPAVILARPQAKLRIEALQDRWDRRLLVQLPMADFGGNVDVDWIDAHGEILASRRFEARDRQFYLDMPEKADKLVVYAADTRNGAQAFGGYGVPKPAPPAQPPAPRPVPAAPIVARPVSVLQNQPDHIVMLNFDGPAPAQGAKRRGR